MLWFELPTFRGEGVGVEKDDVVVRELQSIRIVSSEWCIYCLAFWECVHDGVGPASETWVLKQGMG